MAAWHGTGNGMVGPGEARNVKNKQKITKHTNTDFCVL